jgi:hypothetical protein
MSQASGIRSALPDIAAPEIPIGNRKLWKRWQIVYVLVRTVFFVGFFLLIEFRRLQDVSLLLSTSLRNRVLIQAIILLSIGTILEMLLLALLNSWEAKQLKSGVFRRSVTVIACESLLWFFCFFPAFCALVLGPAASAIMKLVSHD